MLDDAMFPVQHDLSIKRQEMMMQIEKVGPGDDVPNLQQPSEKLFYGTFLIATC